MSAPGPHTQWFMTRVPEPAPSPRQSRPPLLLLYVGVGAGVMAAVVVYALRNDMMSTGGRFGLLSVVMIVGAAPPILWWLNRSKPDSPAGPVITGLGVGAPGLWLTGSHGLELLPWNDMGGIRVYSILSSGSPTVQYLHLDVLAPNQPLIGRHTDGAGGAAVRVALPEAVGFGTETACRRAVDLALTIRRIRPELWRGFFLNNGLGYVEFQSWESPKNTIGASLRTPTRDNFGGPR